MQDRSNRPWLTRSGMEVPIESLKKICRHWDRETWDRYLRWFESNGTEVVLNPAHYEILTEKLKEPALQRHCPSPDEDTVLECEKQLSILPKDEAQVLRSVYLEGRTIRETAAHCRMGKSTAHDKKERAIARLRKKSNDFSDPDTKHLMRGENSEIEQVPSVWDETAKAKLQFLKDAILALPRRQNRVIYLRFWCDQPLPRIARDLVCGSNVAQDICEVAALAIKRKVLQQIFKPVIDGGSTCA